MTTNKQHKYVLVTWKSDPNLGPVIIAEYVRTNHAKGRNKEVVAVPLLFVEGNAVRYKQRCSPEWAHSYYSDSLWGVRDLQCL